MAKYDKMITGQFEAVGNYLQGDIENSRITINLVDESNFTFGDTNIAVSVFDKYLMRNRVSLSLTVVCNCSDIFISAIGASGGQCIIFNSALELKMKWLK